MRIFSFISTVLVLAILIGLSNNDIASRAQDGATPHMNSLDFVDVNHGWAVGNGGLVVHTNNSGDSWQEQDANTTQNLHAVDFVDVNTGWLIGAGGTIRHTTDGGATWQSQNSPLPLDLYGLFFLDSQTGWIGYPDGVLKTTDGGTNWQKIGTGITFQVRSIHFLDANVGFLVASDLDNNSQFLRSTDGGETWAKVENIDWGRYRDVTFVNANFGVVVETFGDTFYTTDGGNNWTTVSRSGGTIHLSAVDFFDESHGWIVGHEGTWPRGMLRSENGGRHWSNMAGSGGNDVQFVSLLNGFIADDDGIIVSIDGGYTWSQSYPAETAPTPQSTSTPGVMNGLDFVNTTHGWVVGNGGQIVHTNDGGTSWQTQDANTTNDLHAVDFVDVNTGWVIGGSGTIRHTADGGTTWQTQNSPLPLDLYGLFFLDNQTGWIGYPDGVLKTTDGGTNWQKTGTGITFQVRSIHFLDENKGFLVASDLDNDSEFLRTIDGGETWEDVENIDWGRYRDVTFVNANFGVVVETFGDTFYTNDGGDNWTRVPRSGSTIHLSAIDFLDEIHGWIVGHEGTWPRGMLRSENGGRNWSNIAGSGGNDVQFVSVEKGFIADDDGIYVSNTSGYTWEKSYPLEGTVTPEAPNTDTPTPTTTLTPTATATSTPLCNSISEIPLAECNALVALYNSTDGANWTNNDGWLQTTTPCNWYGITCQNGTVYQVVLNDNLLVGTIPVALGDLTDPLSIHLYNNQLNGPIPASLGNLTSLQVLSLYRNQLSGTIPAELSKLKNLEALHLYNNQLSGVIPPELGLLSERLEVLNLSNNRLSGSIPSELGNLAMVLGIHLDSNQLTGAIPVELFEPPKLTNLYLHNNQLTGPIPSNLENRLTQLRRLYLSSNQITGAVPSWIGQVASLKELMIDNNPLSGPLPMSLIDLSLDKFHFNDTDVCMPADDAFQEWIDTIPDLQTNGNTCSEVCEIAEGISFKECEALVALYNSTDGANWTNNDGWLQTTTPCSWYGITCRGEHVTKIELTKNDLLGPIPEEISNLTNLTVLGMTNNQLSGPIPNRLGDLSSLIYLGLCVNQLTGSIPSELGNLASLEQLLLCGNKLTGEIPQSLSKLSNLNYIHIGENQLNGDLPAWLGSLSKLTYLHVGTNELIGPIPSELGNLSELTDLILRRNPLTGSIPAELGNLTKLRGLHLFGNQLSGEIPESLGNLTELTGLSLYGNQLTGSIPASLGNLKKLKAIHLYANRLTGAIPPELGQSDSQIEVLYLYGNRLTGSIPPELGNLPDLTHIRLDGNHLSGPLPSELGQLTQLKWLRVGDNLLTGPLPTSLMDLAKLTNLHFHSNKICEPGDEQFQNWLAALEERGTVTSTGIICPIGQSNYEPNDTCDEATMIDVLGMVQEHAFDRKQDTDWVKFNGEAGTRYQINAQTPSTSLADVEINLFDQCDGDKLDEQDHAFTPDVQLEFEAPATATYYMKLTSHDPDIGGSHVRYDLSVRQLLTPSPTNRALILVAGAIKENDVVQPNIYYVTDSARQVFVNHGYTDEQIYYLAADKNRPNVDASATITNLKGAITNWAAERVNSDGVLTIYLMDHGASNRLYLDKLQRQWVSPQEVNDWLDILEAKHPGVQVNIIVEACYSGSFINVSENADSVSSPGRVVIASTGALNLAWASREGGAIFSDYFLNELNRKVSLYESFKRAQQAASQFHRSQVPWLDANGNGIHNEPADWVIAGQRGFGINDTLPDENWAPSVFHGTGPFTSSVGRLTLRSNVRDDQTVKHVWAVIYPITYNAPTESEALVRDEDDDSILTLRLNNTGTDNLYSGSYDGENPHNVGRVVIYAEDDLGLVGSPKAITMHHIRLPFIVFP
ncbi:MAG: YCF48-related protein [Chloroflexota bacterium]